jgi:hypothetical protein
LANLNAPADTNQVQNPDTQHSSLGRGLIHIAHAIEGKQVNHVPDASGNVQEVVTPRKPGGLFRVVILRAIAGNVAASTTRANPGSGNIADILRSFLGFLGRPTVKSVRNHPGIMDAKSMNDILSDEQMRTVLRIYGDTWKWFT